MSVRQDELPVFVIEEEDDLEVFDELEVAWFLHCLEMAVEDDTDWYCDARFAERLLATVRAGKLVLAA